MSRSLARESERSPLGLRANGPGRAPTGRPVAASLTVAGQTLERVRPTQDRRLAEVLVGPKGKDSSVLAIGRRMAATVDEVAELTVRDLGDDRAARAAQQAATGRLCEIAGLGGSVDVHLVCCTQRPDAGAVPGQMKANLDGTVAFRVRAAVNSFILLDSDKASLLPPHPGRAIFAHETVEELQAVDCSVEESRKLLLARWGSGRVSPTTGPVSQWWQSTSRVQTSSQVHRHGRPQDSESRSGHAPMHRP